jgi:hypothetical protein
MPRAVLFAVLARGTVRVGIVGLRLAGFILTALHCRWKSNNPLYCAAGLLDAAAVLKNRGFEASNAVPGLFVFAACAR